LDGRAGVREDTLLSTGGRLLHVVIQRMDTVSIKRSF
jgi:hypothetical protein